MAEDDSFIREVDDELLQDKMNAAWKKYGKWLIAGAVGIVAATAGFRGWDYYTTQQAASSGDKFMAAIELSNNGSHDEAIKQLDALTTQGSGQYPALAKLRIASEMAARGDYSDAIAAYDEIAASASFNDTFKSIAKLRAGLLAVDNNSLEDVKSRLQQLAGPGQPFRHSAREGTGSGKLQGRSITRGVEMVQFHSRGFAGWRESAFTRKRLLDLLAGKGVTKQSAETG